MIFFKFREKIETIVSSVRGIRGINLDYLIRNETATVPSIMEDASRDVKSIDFMRLNTSHTGPAYLKDN